MNATLVFLAILLVLIPCSAADRCVMTVREAPELVPIITNYNETNIITVQHFLNHLEPCPWGGVCGMHARYISIEAEKAGLQVGETTIYDWDHTRAKRMVMDGGTRYYTANLYDGDIRIVTRPDLCAILRDIMDGT